MNNGVAWTTLQVKYLRENYARQSLWELCKHFDLPWCKQSQRRIYGKARKLGLKKYPVYE